MAQSRLGFLAEKITSKKSKVVSDPIEYLRFD